jgi:hypothetical protein
MSWREHSAVRPAEANNPSHIGFTFAAVDGDESIADPIGGVFDALLTVSLPGLLSEGQEGQWERHAQMTDYRVIHASGWNIVNGGMIPITSFGAGGAVWLPPDR